MALKYKISNSPVFNNQINNPNNPNIYKAVNENYKVYYDSPNMYKIEYGFIFQAVYACLTKVNSYSNRRQAFDEFVTFIKYIESNTEIKFKTKMDIMGNITFTTKRKSKVKIIKHYQRAA